MPTLQRLPVPAAVDIHGHAVYTGSLMGKVTLVVNVASRCGYTGGDAAPCLFWVLLVRAWGALRAAKRGRVCVVPVGWEGWGNKGGGRASIDLAGSWVTEAAGVVQAARDARNDGCTVPQRPMPRAASA